MRNLLYLSLLLATPIFCEAQTGKPSTVRPTKKVQTDESSKFMIGTWNGEMNGKKLSIVIEKISGKEISGYNMLGTTKRPVKGTLTDGDWDQSCSKAYQATLKEPGTDKWDGVFEVKFIGYKTETETAAGGLDCTGNYKGSEAIGNWKSNNGKMKSEFRLEKKE